MEWIATSHVVRYFPQYEANKKEKLENQLREVRLEKHNLYKVLSDQRAKSLNSGTNYYYNEREKNNPDECWPPNTILILGDSMINQLDEDRLSESSKKVVKVTSFGGFGINDIY